MNIHKEIISQYLNEEPISDFHHIYPRTTKRESIDYRRKDVVQELVEQLTEKLEKNNIFNAELGRLLFTNYDAILSDIHIFYVVGAPCDFDIHVIKKDEKNCIYIDLIQIANQTSVVKEMIFLIMHEVSKICYRLCLPNTQPQSYHEFLNSITFYNGLLTYLSWNEDYHNYHFQHSRYDKKREVSFSNLYNAYKETDSEHQRQLIHYLSSASFWDKFTTISGLFYIYDIVAEKGDKALLQLYETHGKRFIDHIFQS